MRDSLNSGITCYHSARTFLPSHLLPDIVRIGLYKIIILPLVLYGCETWSPTFREGYRLKVFGNRVLRRIFGLKRYEVTGEWRKLHNEELRDLYSSPSIIRTIKPSTMRWAVHIVRMWDRKNACVLLVGKQKV
jgi:hypothetical protein